MTSFCHLASASASEQVATLSELQGEAKIFSHPSKKLTEKAKGEKGSTQVLFEGEYFQVKNAKVGDVIENGTIFRTAPNAKARVIYPNGDQINIGSGSAYRIHFDTNTRIDLMYGKLRGIIEKGGPRSKLQVRTRAAVMGVRGTDFFVADDGETKITLIRGRVEVTPRSPHSVPVDVAAGHSVTLDSPPFGKQANKAPVPKVELQKTSQVEYIQIQKATSINPTLSQKAVSPEAQEKIAMLTTKATQTTLKDIEKYDPTLYSSLKGKGDLSVDELNRAAMQELFKKAPEAPIKSKPGKKEMEKLENGAYDKYFKLHDT